MNPGLLLPRVRRLAGENKLFTGALAAGAILRLLAAAGYPGALWFGGDSYVYVGAALRPQPNLSKSTGYSLFLRLLLPFHSFTLVTTVQHLMGLTVAVLLYVMLRRNGVSTTWSALATLPELLDGYIIEDEHLIMAESLFTFLLMVALFALLWRPDRVRWWLAVTAGLLAGYAAVVRTEGAVMLVVLPLFLLLRGWGWKTVRGWLVAVTFAVASLIPVSAYAAWFHQHNGSYGMTLSTGFYLYGRVSSFANCAVIKPTGPQALICPAEPLARRTPPGNFIWHASELHPDLARPGDSHHLTGSPVTSANNTLLTRFAIHAVQAQPLAYAKTVFFNTMLSFGFPRIAYPGAGTVYFYSFHTHYVHAATATTRYYNELPPDHEWIKGGPADQDWLSYGRQAPGVVDRAFAVPILVYERVAFTYGPLLALIFLTGLGGVLAISTRRRGPGLRSALSFATLRSLRLHWSRRGTTMLPWFTAVALLVAPIAVADFDYRYLIPAIPFACLAAGLSFAPRRTAPAPAAPEPSAPVTVESAV